ncbi:MAG TPA: right-handed parallel beta-helix repeat-containing protein [Kofleriaceae bacterium]|nr:right-handed parallel beta-helix repeat-containing protein [Kofleriaceae bacterium]
MPSTPLPLVAALLLAACSKGGHDGAGERPPTGPSAGGPPPAAPAPTASVACTPGSGTTYEIGPGKKLAKVTEVPWETLGPGDTVLIHHRAEPYREKIHLSSRGTPEQPIRVCGVRGPGGELPVLDGADAISRAESKFPYVPTQDRGLVVVTPRVGYKWGERPGHILIQDLVLRGASGDEATPVSFTNSEGKVVHYSRNAAAVFVERGEHITVRGCTLTDSSYGLFVASGGSEEVMSREILIEGNYIHGNGIVGVDRRHNVYAEAAGITFQFNRFGPQRKGALGNQLKDRSTGTIIRFNWIEGGAHLLDLVEPEESAAITVKDPRYHDTWVYGNVLISGPDDGSTLVHYGGDNGILPTYRKGTLHFYHNTVVVRADEGKRYQTTLLALETADETADVRNNVFFRDGTTHLCISRKKGKVVLGTNWITAGYESLKYKDGDGVIEGEKELLLGADTPFANLDGGDLRPGAASPIRAAGGPMPADLPAEHAITTQYSPHQQAAPRAKSGPGANLGAFE